MSHNITVEGGTSVRLPTAGKYCDRDIIVTATGSGGGGNVDAIIDRSITSIRSNVTEVGYHAFQRCSKLESVNFPNADSIDGYCFNLCTSLKSADLPKVQSVAIYAFEGCTALENVNLPSVRSVLNYAFKDCAALKKIDLNQATKINASAFYNCSNLEAVILRRTGSICTLSSTNAFQLTKIASGGGYFYVHREMLSDNYSYLDYRRATNWSTYASRFRAIEDYPDICGGV